MSYLEGVQSALAAPFKLAYQYPKTTLAFVVGSGLVSAGVTYQAELVRASDDLLEEAPNLAHTVAKSIIIAQIATLAKGALVIVGAKLGMLFVHSPAGRYVATTGPGQWVDRHVKKWIPEPRFTQRIYNFASSFGGLRKA